MQVKYSYKWSTKLIYIYMSVKNGIFYTRYFSRLGCDIQILSVINRLEIKEFDSNSTLDVLSFDLNINSFRIRVVQKIIEN